MALRDFPFIPDQVKFREISDFYAEVALDETFQEKRVNKLKYFDGVKRGYNTRIEAKMTLDEEGVSSLFLFYNRYQGGKHSFLLPGAFWRNVNDENLIATLNSFLTNSWAFEGKPRVRTVVSGIYEATLRLYNKIDDADANRGSYEEILVTEAGTGVIRFSAPVLNPGPPITSAPTSQISASINVTAPELTVISTASGEINPAIIGVSAPVLDTISDFCSERADWYPESEEFKGQCTYTQNAWAKSAHFGQWINFDTTVSGLTYLLDNTLPPGFHVYVRNSGLYPLVFQEQVELLGTISGNLPPDRTTLLVHLGEGIWQVVSPLLLEDLGNVSRTELPLEGYLLSYREEAGEYQAIPPDLSLFSGTTDDLPEGDENLYFTKARVDTRLDEVGLTAIGDVSAVGSDAPVNDEVIAWDAGRGLYVPKPVGSLGVELEDLVDTSFPPDGNRTDKWVVQWDADTQKFILDEVSLAASSTDQLPEGNTNLYYTNQRVRNYIAQAINLGDLHRVNTNGKEDRSILIYDSAGGVWRTELLNEIAINSTDDVPEGDYNLYYTNSRVNSYIRNFVQIGELQNVDDSGVVAGDALIWDGRRYVPGNPNAGISIKDLGDVDDNMSPVTDDVLAWTGIQWTSKNLLETLKLGNLANVDTNSGYNHFLIKSGFGADAQWVSKPLFDNKGDILVGTGGYDGFTNLPVGPSGRILIADADRAEGVRWGNPLPAFITIQTISGNYTLQKQDHNSLFRVNDNATITLPTDVTEGYYVYIRLENSGTTCLLQTSGTLDGMSELTVAGQQVRAIFEGGPDNIWFISQIEVGGVGDLTTDDVVEGDTNQYYEDSKVTTLISQTNIEVLSNVSFTSPTDNQLVARSGNQWVNIDYGPLFDSSFTQANLADLGTKRLADLEEKNLSALDDTPSTTANEGDILEYDSTAGAYTHSNLETRVMEILANSRIEDIGNVSDISANDADTLSFNAAENKWKASASSGGGGGSDGGTGSSDITDFWLFGGI